MTPEEWAARAWEYWNFSLDDPDEQRKVVAEMFREAILAERQACRLAADRCRPHYHSLCGCGECTGVGMAVDAIEARSKTDA